MLQSQGRVIDQVHGCTAMPAEKMAWQKVQHLHERLP
jgi:hypothetical protein